MNMMSWDALFRALLWQLSVKLQQNILGAHVQRYMRSFFVFVQNVLFDNEDAQEYNNNYQFIDREESSRSVGSTACSTRETGKA